jgi:histidine triad (HIT) family protein
MNWHGAIVFCWIVFVVLMGRCGFRGFAASLGWLPKPVPYSFQDFSMTTIFSKIIAGEIPADVLYEDDLCLAFRDINPRAPIHFLVIPKKEIVSLADLSDEDEAIVGRCVLVASKVAEAEGLSGGYRLVANTREDGGQEVMHLHFHILGGRKLDWPPG